MHRIHLKQNLINIFKHDLISGSFYLFLGTTISSALAFILNLFLVRSLSYIDYGIFAAMISIILLLTIPAQSISAVIVRYATKFFTLNENDRAGAFYFKLFKYLLLFCSLIIIFFVVFSPLIGKFLHINDYSVIIVSGITVAALYLATLNIAFLQSLLMFKKLSLITVFGGLSKLLAGVFLVALQFKALGALLGNLMFPVFTFLSGLFFLRKVIATRNAYVDIPLDDFTKYAFPTIIALISLSSFISTDVILVKHYFTPVDAGLYGGLSLIGRVIYYFTAPIALVMFPLVVKKHTKGEDHRSLLYLSILLVLGASMFITIFYFLFPEFTVSIFLGGRAYYSLIPLVGFFGVFITLFSINNVFVNYFLSIRKTFVAYIVLFASILQIILIILFHETFAQILSVSISVSILLTLLMVLYYLKINEFKFVKMQSPSK